MTPIEVYIWQVNCVAFAFTFAVFGALLAAVLMGLSGLASFASIQRTRK